MNISRQTIDFILLTVGTLGPLAVSATIFSKRHSYERWARIALMICAFDAVAWGLSGFVESSIDTRNRWYGLVSHFHSVFAGIGLGLFLLLILSGQLKTRPRQTTTENSKK